MQRKKVLVEVLPLPFLELEYSAAPAGIREVVLNVTANRGVNRRESPRAGLETCRLRRLPGVHR
jgi:hypothetical protein